MSPIIMIGAGTLVLVLGIGLGLLIGNIRQGKEMAKTAEVKAELDEYRRQVSEHFNTTAVHFETIGAEYRRLYEHMAAGAGSLCEFRPSVFATPVEQIANENVDEDIVATPPRDYEAVVESDADTSEEVIAAEGPEDLKLSDPEPSDQELEETETAEEILAEHEISPDSVEAEKTIH